MDYLSVIDKYYPEDNELRRLLITHSRQVAERCLRIASKHPELHLDTQFLEEAAMLHDIGIVECDAPGIQCFGTQPYICHGIIGGRMLRQMGLERHAQVCERHTGTGITREQIVSQRLPLPIDGLYEPQTLEEQVVCYADKFYSKSHPDRERTVQQAADSLRRFGDDCYTRFLSWAQRFGTGGETSA